MNLRRIYRKVNGTWVNFSKLRRDVDIDELSRYGDNALEQAFNLAHGAHYGVIPKYLMIKHDKNAVGGNVTRNYSRPTFVPSHLNLFNGPLLAVDTLKLAVQISLAHTKSTWVAPVVSNLLDAVVAVTTAPLRISNKIVNEGLNLVAKGISAIAVSFSSQNATHTRGTAIKNKPQPVPESLTKRLDELSKGTNSSGIKEMSNILSTAEPRKVDQLIVIAKERLGKDTAKPKSFLGTASLFFRKANRDENVHAFYKALASLDVKKPYTDRLESIGSALQTPADKAKLAADSVPYISARGFC